jgi:uncharacterized protein
MEQVKENLKAAEGGIENSLGKDELRIFNGLRHAMKAKIKADCTACRYCMPCASGVDIPDVLAALNRAAIWNDPNPWLTGYTVIGGKAGKCTQCKSCAEVCPQELPVSALMEEAVPVFNG